MLMSVPGRSTSLVSILALLALSGCGLVEEPELGDAISGPFAIAGQPGTRNVFVLNSAFSGAFRNGSLLRFELDAAGRALAKKEATAVPRLGADLVASPDGALLAAAFNEGTSRVKFFTTTTSGRVTALPFEYTSRDGILSQLQFFAPKQRKEGEWYLSLVENPGSTTSRAVALRITAKGVTRVLSLPDDLPYAKPEDYAFGYTAPAFVRDQGLFVAFPQGASGVEPRLPDPIAFLKGDWKQVKKEDTDLRFVSMVVVDFDALLSGTDVGSISAFRPLVYDEDARPGDVKLASDAERNKTVGFRASYSAAVGLDQTACLGGVAPTDASLSADAVLVADDSTEDVLALEGFAKTRAALAALPAASGKEHKSRLLPQASIGLSLYSRKKGVPVIDVEEATRVSRLRVVRRGLDCVPVWLRTERGRNSQGNEVSRLQANFQRAPQDPLRYEVATRGSASFGVLSLGSGEDARAFAFTVSYSRGDVGAYEFKTVGKGIKKVLNGGKVETIVDTVIDDFRPVK